MKQIGILAVIVLFVACAPAPSAPEQPVPLPSNQAAQPAGKLIASGYTITPPDARYSDETQKQLSDSLLGDDIFNKNLSGTPGFEWVGWNQSNASLTFRFSGSKKITKVSIGVNRNDGAGIGLPTRVLINNKSFVVNGNAVSNVKRGFLNFNPDINSETITITLERSERNWLFVDEVLFEGI
jgi:hypothetical protein